MTQTPQHFSTASGDDRASQYDAQIKVGDLSAPGGGQAVGINYGTAVQQYFQGPFRLLRQAVIDLDPLPGDLRLVDPEEPTNPVGLFRGREKLIGKIDAFLALCVQRRRGGFLLVEAEAGMGKSALAAYLAFTRAWPAHFTRLAEGRDSATARRNLAAQLIARWKLTDAAPGGVLPEGAGTTGWLHGRLCDSATARDRDDPGVPVVLLIDGLDEAPVSVGGELPLGLPPNLPAGTVIVATTRPKSIRIPAGSRVVERIDVESEANRTDLLDYLTVVTARDPLLSEPLNRAQMDSHRFCRTLVERSGGVWIYALSILDQIRDHGRSPKGVDRLPASLAGYYAENVRRWQDELGDHLWETAGLPVLTTVTAIREPMSVARIAAWADVPPAMTRTILRGMLKPFLAVRRGGDPDLYVPRHQSLRDFCDGTSLLDSDDDGLRELAYDLAAATRAAHRRIAVAVEPSGPVGRRDWAVAGRYARTYLAEHAALGGQLDELITDPQFGLFVGVACLLRQRRHLTTAEAKKALAALELAAGHNNDDALWLRWIEVSARKMRADTFADRAASLVDETWHPIRAMWTGNSHRTLIGHTKTVRAVTAVPLRDGRTLLASAGDDGSIRLWDPIEGTPAGTLTGHTARVFALAVVPLRDGRTLLASAGDDGSIRLWDPIEGTPAGTLTGHTVGGFSLAVVPLTDGRTLLASAGADKAVRLWDPVAGTLAGTLTGHTDWVRAVTAVPLPDGGTLLATAGDDRAVRLWDPIEGTPAGTLTGHTDWVNALTAVPLPDGGTLLASAGSDGSVRLWDPITATLTGHTGRVNALAVVPLPDDGALLASAGNDGSVRLWDPIAATAVGTLTGHTAGVRAVTAVPLPDGGTLLATAGDDRAVRLWDPIEGTPAGTLTGHTDWVNALTAVPLPDGGTLLASAGSDGSVRLWDPITATLTGTLSSHTDWVRTLAAVPLPGGGILLASAGAEGSLRLWDPTEGTPAGILTGHTGWVRTLAAVPLPGGGTLLASAGNDGSVRLWDPIAATAVGALTGHTAGVNALTAVPLPDSRILLASAGDDGSVRLWNPVTAVAVGALTGHTEPVNAVATLALPDGRVLLASAGYDGSVRLWDPIAGTLAGILTGHTAGVNALTAVPLPDSRILLASAGDDGSVRLWNPVTAVAVGALTGHTEPVNAVATLALPDGRVLLASAGDDRAIILWQALAGTVL
ncbi:MULTISPECIES: NACHT and WD repeat domain-containing protein [Frankia]|uniref:Uncharacterized protein n=1 Tax=Frankia alni (strain DSM 45986 / CECT 9034 / ACN14a) TaxID=326424 RepID=Q0RC65_FRAAA|nr:MULTISPECIES: WD40 repeat domain-containing protein [Frankia]CAJ64963.1 hypothetical protein; putative WD-repeat protein [Frankia alni ACN14a]